MDCYKESFWHLTPMLQQDRHPVILGFCQLLPGEQRLPLRGSSGLEETAVFGLEEDSL